jgi:activating signal cointegrator complex subunit 1
MPRNSQKSIHRGPKTGTGRGGGGKRPSKPPLTHFLCIPLVNESSRSQLQDSLSRFSTEVRSLKPPTRVSRSGEQELGNASPSASEPIAVNSAESQQNTGDDALIPERAIRPLGTLHLTLGVMSLQSEEKVDEAIHFLRSIDMASLLEEAAELRDQDGSAPQPSESKAASAAPEPLTISLSSLTSMHPPQKTSILYTAPSDPTARILPFCASLVNLFRSADLVLPDDRPLKLHATVVNTIYAKAGGRGSGHGPNAKAPIRLDAREVLERYQDWVWAKDVKVGKVAICKMGAKKILGEGGKIVAEEYEEVASVSLPT